MGLDEYFLRFSARQWRRKIVRPLSSIRMLPFAFGTLSFGVIAYLAPAQTDLPNEFSLTKVTRNLITAPQFSYSGAEQFQADQRQAWLQIEAEFTARPVFTSELTVKYFILVAGRLITGEVTHVNISAGSEVRSVMYVPPAALAHLNNNRPLTIASIQNVAVQIVQGGTAKSEMSATRAPAGWFAKLTPLFGFVLNKNETPFAPLYWDRYAQIKPSR